MINQNWWFTTLLLNKFKYCPPLTKHIKCDVLIVGGGISGISAAAEFLNKGLSVVMIEKNIVGGSSTGKSAGFLTPDSELELHQLVRRYGIDAAREIWEAGNIIGKPMLFSINNGWAKFYQVDKKREHEQIENEF